MAKTTRKAESRTESLLKDLLKTQGWDARKPPKGNFLIKQEYKDIEWLDKLFKSKNKTGKDGFPEGIIISDDNRILAVIEAKASLSQLDLAIEESRFYTDEAIRDGHYPVAIAIVGDEDDFKIRVSFWDGASWNFVTYDNNAVDWIPTPTDMDYIYGQKGNSLIDLRPSIPSSAILAENAETINRLLRESKIKDEYRPTVVAAIMLALWHTKGNIRRDPAYVLKDINSACEEAFKKAGKPSLSESIRVEEGNAKLAEKARIIISILTKLNVASLTAEHDYLGQVYETFFRYTGGNTIGQYFTPRHIAYLAAELSDVKSTDKVLDPACGTGGFLIAAMERAAREEGLTRTKIVSLVSEMLTGFETEPVTAALCVANMILRGDGTTGVHADDSLTSKKFPINIMDVVLMNPPFPHKNTDAPTEEFIDRGLDSLKDRGILAAIIPSSLLSKSSKKEWRDRITEKNSIRAVISLPSELFQPYAAATTALILIEKGTKNKRATFFARISSDGFKLKKGVRQQSDDNDIPEILDSYNKSSQINGMTGIKLINSPEGWSAGAYIDATQITHDEVKIAVSASLRTRLSSYSLHVTDIEKMKYLISIDELKVRYYKEIISDKRKVRKISKKILPGSIGEYFDIFYGQKELHSKEGLLPGSGLVISSSGSDSGFYGFFNFKNLIAPPFVTVPSTGSIGEAYVQNLPCGVTDDCLLLIPKASTPDAMLYIASAAIRRERWRFDYGRKITPERIQDIPLINNPALNAWIEKEVEKINTIESMIRNELVEPEEFEISEP